MSYSYLFYDIETTGLNVCFDQILRFAAIRTDLCLNEKERYEIFVKLNLDIIPSPSAMLIHQLNIEKMLTGICEYEAIKKIHHLFNIPGTITVGYNNFGFDDEFLRFSFYRNLFDPYKHQYVNGCRRMDIYPMTVMYYLFRPKIVSWPILDGVVTLKLEHLNTQNNFVKGNAHEAINDVLTTIKLARLLKTEEDMWKYLTKNFIKKIDFERSKKFNFFNEFQIALLIEGRIGVAKFYQTPVIGIGMHKHYKNQSLWVSLESNFKNMPMVYRKRFGDPPLLLPFNRNYSGFLDGNRLNLVKSNLYWIKKNPENFYELVELKKQFRFVTNQDLDVDAALYQQEFINEGDRAQCDKFHSANLLEKLSMLDCFSRGSLREQAIRILWRNYPMFLDCENIISKEFSKFFRKIKSGQNIVNYKNEVRMTPTLAIREINDLLSSSEIKPSKKSLLDELAKYILSL